METYKEMLVKLLEGEPMAITFPGLRMDAKDLLKAQSYITILRIQQTINSTTLSDAECIKEIVVILRDGGVYCDNHNFNE